MIRKKEIGIPCYNMPLQLNIHFKNRLKAENAYVGFFLIGGEEDVSCCWQQTSLCSSGLLPLLQSCNATHLCFFLRKSICVSTMICAKKMQPYGLSRIAFRGGEEEIRTLEPLLTVTRFPVARPRPN